MDKLNEEEIKAMRLADNQIARMSELEMELVIDELKGLSMQMLDLTGFDRDLVNGLSLGNEDNIPEKKTKTNIKIGDLFKLDKHLILCGSSTNELDVEKLMGGVKAKMIFTSPPYNMGANMYKNYKDNLKSEEYIKFNIDVINNFIAYLKGFIFWNISYNKNTRGEFIEILFKIIKETGLKFVELIVWNKKHGMPIVSQNALTRQYEDILLVGDDISIKNDLELYMCGRNDEQAYFNKKTNRGITNYWEIGTNKTQLDNHKACYPVALPTKGIILMTQEKDIVVDPFLGSGTTLIACEKTKRTCYGMELDPLYVDVCIRRWEEFTGLKAKKL